MKSPVPSRAFAPALMSRPPIVENGAVERAVGLRRRQRRFQPLQESRCMGEMAIHAGEDQGLRSIAEAVEPQYALPGLRRHVGLRNERRQVDVGRR